MTCLDGLRVGDQIATVRHGALGGERPSLTRWEIINVTKTTVRARSDGVARSWSIANGYPVSVARVGEAMRYSQGLQAQHDERVARWEEFQADLETKNQPNTKARIPTAGQPSTII